MVRGRRLILPRCPLSTAHSASPIPASSRTASTRTSNQARSTFHRSIATPSNKTRARWLRPMSSRSRPCSSVPTTRSRPASRIWAANCRQSSLVNSRCTVASFLTRSASQPSTTRADTLSKSRVCIVRLLGWDDSAEAAQPRLPLPTATARSTWACQRVALCGRTRPRCLTLSLRRPTCSRVPPPSTSARSPTPGAKTTQTWSPSRSSGRRRTSRLSLACGLRFPSRLHRRQGPRA